MIGGQGHGSKSPKGQIIKNDRTVIQYHFTRVSVVDEFDSGILFDILGVDQVIKVMVEVKAKAAKSAKDQSHALPA